MRIDDFIDRYEDIAFSEYHRNIVKIMLKDLLILAAEKAVIKTQKKSVHGKSRKWQNVKESEEFDLFQFEMKCSVDKNSILNILSDERI